MKFEIELDEERLINGIMESYPEYSSPSIICEHWDYEHTKFKFYDAETDKHYDVDMEMLKTGLKKFFELYLCGKYNNGIRDGMRIDDEGRAGMLDGGNWDSMDADALVQCAIFGDIIYG